MSGDDPPYLPVGTDVSAKYKGAFCEAKVSKVVRLLQLKVTYNGAGLGTGTVTDEQIRYPVNGNQSGVSGLLPLRVGQTIQVKHPEKKEYVNATINRIRDCSQYTVVFDDGDITTLRRTALCLKSGRHFNESETLDQLPLTHPEHFGNPVVGGRRGRRSRQLKEDSSDDEDLDDTDVERSSNSNTNAANIGRDVGKVVCVETSEGKRKASRDSNWFPGLVVAPTAQAAVRINTREECLIRSFKDGRYYTVPRKEMTEFKKDGTSARVDSPPLAEAVDKALNYLNNAELPQHWDKDTLFGLHLTDFESDENYTDSSDDEPREEKDHFVAQLYKFMDDRGTPLNKVPMISNRDVDLYRFFRIVEKLGGYNSVTNKNRWRAVTARLGFTKNSATTLNLVKQAYYRFLFPFEEFNRKLGCTMVSHPRSVSKKNRGRSLIRDKDRATPVQTTSASPKPETKIEDSNDTTVSAPEKDKKEDLPTEKDESTKKKIKTVLKEEPIVKIRKESDVTDSSSSEGILDVINDTPTVAIKRTIPDSTSGQQSNVQKIKDIKKQLESKLSGSAATKRAKVPNTGEKVKSLIEKFEDQAKLDDDDKVQQTRSKSTAVLRKDSTAPSPDRKGREGKKEDGNNKSNNSGSKPQRANRPSADEEKKRGRKKKEPEEKTHFSDSSMSDAPSVVTVTNVSIGDKLKVYYGPNLESKVTYEAKVLEIERDDAGPIYLVHYTGWNNRYDEWIKPHRIAENISQSSKGKRPSKTSNAKSSTATTNATTAAKRGRGASVSSRNTSQENQGPPTQARSTTPSSVTSTSSRTKSPATPAARAPSARLAKQAETVTKRSASTGTQSGNQSLTRQSSTASDSDSASSDVDEAPKRRPIKRKEETPESTVDTDDGPSERPKRARKTPKKNSTEPTVVLTSSNSKVITSPVSTTPVTTPTVSLSTAEVIEPKGRDFDLNQIRSELKGFEKALKITTPSCTNTPSTEEPSVPVPKPAPVEAPKAILNKTITQEEIKKNEKTPEKEIKEKDKDKEIKEIKIVTTTDDIYEFKEPEPLELESRSTKLNEEKVVKKRRLLEDLDKATNAEKPSPNKKKVPNRTPPKSTDVKTSGDTNDKKPRVRRNFIRKSEDSESSSSPGSKSPSSIYNIKSENIPSPTNENKSRNVYANDDVFDKLVVSPSYNIDLKVETVSPPPSPIEKEKIVQIVEEVETKVIIAEEIIEDKIIETIETITDIKDASSLENSDEDDPIHEAIRGIAESKDDEDSTDNLLISQTFTPIVTKVLEPMKEICTVVKEVSISDKPLISQTIHKDILKETGILTPLCDVQENTIIVSEIKVEAEQIIVPEPLTIKTEKPPQIKKEEKTKQISPALQETDSSLLEAVISQQTSDLSNAENIFIPKRTGPRIAGSILQKFESIKKKEENPSPVKVNTSDSDEKPSPLKITEELHLDMKIEVKEEHIELSSPVSSLQQDFKKRLITKKTVREYIESDDMDSSDSEERLIIARSDDESQLSQPESVISNTNTEKLNIDSIKDTDSNGSVLRINTEESSQDSKAAKQYSFDSPISETKVKLEEKPESTVKEEEPDSNISLLLCEETIPGSPAPVNENVTPTTSDVRVKPKSAKSLALEIPFASAPGTSKTLLSEQLKHNGVKSEIKPIISGTQTNINTVSSSSSISNISTVVGTIVTTNASSNPSKISVVTESVKEESDDNHAVVVNSPPTTPESSISNSPRGENGGSSPGTADESNKSQRGSENSEAEPFSSSSGRMIKPQHYSEEDTLLNSETTTTTTIKKNSPRSINEDSQPAIVSNTITSIAPTSASNTSSCRKRRRSYKGDDQTPTTNNNNSNPSGSGAKRGRKPNALKNLRNTPTNVPMNNSLNSDSDDMSEHSNTPNSTTTITSSVTITSTIHQSNTSGNTGTAELRLQSVQHSSMHRTSKYNFVVDLDPNMEPTQRIALLQQRIAELRKAYSQEKNELASIERRLKKIKRREREAIKAAKQEVACS